VTAHDVLDGSVRWIRDFDFEVAAAPSVAKVGKDHCWRKLSAWQACIASLFFAFVKVVIF